MERKAAGGSCHFAAKGRAVGALAGQLGAEANGCSAATECALKLPNCIACSSGGRAHLFGARVVLLCEVGLGPALTPQRARILHVLPPGPLRGLASAQRGRVQPMDGQVKKIGSLRGLARALECAQILLGFRLGGAPPLQKALHWLQSTPSMAKGEPRLFPQQNIFQAGGLKMFLN